jgi:two-component system, NarL family, invasion response regulator UvrY
LTGILVVDDHAIVRTGIKRLLSPFPEYEVLEAATGEDSLALMPAGAVKLVLLDLNLPGLRGLELLRRLLRFDPLLPVLVFSMHGESAFAASALKAGARGYVSKNAAPDELLKAIRVVIAGGSYVEQEIASDLDERQTTTGAYLRPLTGRDLIIMRMLAQGRSLTEIAGELGIAYKTAANTCTHIKEKLGVTRTADLIRISIERELG